MQRFPYLLVGRLAVLCLVLSSSVVIAATPVSFAAEPTIKLVPDDAAFHQRSSNWPLRESHTLTQSIIRSIQEKKETASGTVVTRDANFDVALEYSFGLHRDMVSLDNLDVLSFEHSNKFAARIPRGSLTSGSLLIGSHLGKWSFTAGSRHAVLGGSKDANSGGVAYLRRVVSVVHVDDGISHVETTEVEGADADRIFPRGRLTLGWNHTKTDKKQMDFKRDFVDRATVDEFFSGPASAWKPGGYANMPHDRRLEYMTDYCDDQCIGSTYATGWDYLQDDDINEACVYCFEYKKSLASFNFNYDGSGKPPRSNAVTDTLYPAGSSVQFLTCKQCTF
jgi:hypothetical protein